jgi:hypothetical protein
MFKKKASRKKIFFKYFKKNIKFLFIAVKKINKKD